MILSNQIGPLVLIFNIFFLCLLGMLDFPYFNNSDKLVIAGVGLAMQWRWCLCYLQFL